MSLLRTFLAIEIPPEIKKAIFRQSDGLRQAAGRSVRWTSPENLHLTLQFLGDTTPASLSALTQAIPAEAGQHPPFDLTLRGLGAFPSLHRPRIIWIGLEAPADLPRLQRSLETVTAQLGYPSDDKPFSPHLTIGRVRDPLAPAELQTLRAALETTKIDALGTFTVPAVHLFKSDLQPGGPIYARLFTAQLKN
jgi:2'-5' RNA ligase